jgi:hypothetical protein
MRTTSKSPNQTPTEAQAREALSQYITQHLAIETQETAAKKDIELIKEAVAIACKPLVEAKAYAESILMSYAEGHPELFKDRRKTELWGGHKIGYQTSPPAVILVRPPGEKKKQTWDGFVAACKRLGAAWLGMIRTSEAPDKEAVLEFWRTSQALADAKGDVMVLKGVEADLARLGVAVAQEERFVIDLNLQPEAEKQ